MRSHRLDEAHDGTSEGDEISVDDAHRHTAPASRY